MPHAADAIIGHKDQVSSLLTDIEADNVSHAYLFTGRPHLGKFTVAKWFAEKLLTVDATDDAERARQHREIERLLHKDLLVIDQLWMEDVCEDFEAIAKYSNVPQQHRAKAGAKTDTISIEDVRALQERLHEVGGGRYRCCLIREASRLQDEAVNALLKLIEEPPPGVVFVLTTQSRSLLLPTLVSRSRVLRFSPLPHAQMVPLVRDVPEEDAQFLLRIAQGAPGTVLRLKRDPDALLRERQQYAQAVSFWHTASLAERLKLLEPVMERGDESAQFLLHLALALREEKDENLSRRSNALHLLLHDLQTNASRPLLAQRFALSV